MTTEVPQASTGGEGNVLPLDYVADLTGVCASSKTHITVHFKCIYFAIH